MELKGYLGVYASTESLGIKRKLAPAKQVYLWFVWEHAKYGYMVQAIDVASREVHMPFSIEDAVFTQYLVAQPHITLLPKETPQYDVLYAKRVRISGATASAYADVPYDSRFPYTKKELYEALDLDHNLRVNFALALMQYKKGHKHGVFQGFEEILATNNVIEPHKHMFAGFGVEFRKLGLNTLALKMQQQVLDLAPHDTHALCNLGRVHFELGQFVEAAEYAQEALEKEPSLLYAQQLLKASLRHKRRLDNLQRKKTGKSSREKKQRSFGQDAVYRS